MTEMRPTFRHWPRAHPQIRTLVIQGAHHGGEQGVLRRPEFMTTLREFLAASR